MGWIWRGIGCFTAPFTSSRAESFFLELLPAAAFLGAFAFFASFAETDLVLDEVRTRPPEDFAVESCSANGSGAVCRSCLAIESANQAFFPLARPLEAGRLCHSAEPVSPAISGIERPVSTE